MTTDGIPMTPEAPALWPTMTITPQAFPLWAAITDYDGRTKVGLVIGWRLRVEEVDDNASNEFWEPIITVPGSQLAMVPDPPLYLWPTREEAEACVDDLVSSGTLNRSGHRHVQ